MAKVPTSILKTLKRYLVELEKENIHIRSAILYGSYANGNFHEFSDIDIALVSDDFQGNRFYDKQKIARATLAVDYRIDPLPYRPEDFDESSLFVKEIITSGIRITP